MSNNPKKPTWVRLIWPVIIVFLLYLLYMATLHPALATLFFPAKAHIGVNLYIQNEYLEYDKGKVLQEALAKMPFMDSAQVEQFSYYDHARRDNLFYGKFCDAYVVDLYMGQQYDAAKKFVLQNGRDCHYIDDYNFYWIEEAVATTEDCFIVALCDRAQIVRCVLIADYENTLGFAGSAYSTLYRNFSIEWEYD